MPYNTMRRSALLVAFGVSLYVALSHLDVVLDTLAGVLGVFTSVIAGLLIAFVLNVPVSGTERLLRRAADRLPARIRPSDCALSGASIAIVLLAILAVAVLAATMVVPQLAASVRSVYPLLAERLPQIERFLGDRGLDIGWITSALPLGAAGGAADLKGLLRDDIAPLLGSLLSAAKSTLSGAASFGFGVIIAVYVLASKREISRTADRFVDAFLPGAWARRVRHVAALTSQTYARFLSGQCIEACILGTLIFVAYSLFGLPYAGLIGFLTAIMALVPYLGAFASCAIGAFLILLAAPDRVALSVVVYACVQFVENQFIYPHVVGSSVGLSALWTLVAALVGGNLFGVLGVVFFIPLVAVLVALVDEQIDRRLAQRGPRPSRGTEIP